MCEYHRDVLSLRAEMLRSWRSLIDRVVKAIRKYLPDAEVYIIGSVAEGKFTGASDLDLLVVSRHVPKKMRELAELKIKIEDEANLPLYYPIESHFTTPEEAELYLRRSRRVIKLT